VVRQAHHERERWLDKLTMNGIIKIPFTLSLSKGVFGVLQEALMFKEKGVALADNAFWRYKV
jgi:hypothetical protein